MDVLKGESMEPRVIKTAEDHKAALVEVERLMDLDPKDGSTDAERLELFARLVEDFEGNNYAFAVPDALDAIRFRMEEQGLRQRDLIPFIGSRSKVSEVLGGKRPLNAEMLRALHVGLGIPSTALLKRTVTAPSQSSTPDWSRYPFREMRRRGWISGSLTNSTVAIEAFFAKASSIGTEVAAYRKTIKERSGKSMDCFALQAWTARVLIRAQDRGFTKEFKPTELDDVSFSQLVKLSTSERGPLLAQSFLADRGIALVVEPHLPRTHLDGAAMFVRSGNPVIGMTLRHDRIDNFWFTLIHEMVHISRHLGQSLDEVFVDDLDMAYSDDAREAEADRIAGNYLIPRIIWKRSHAYQLGTQEAVLQLASQLSIHPAIVAGRIRREKGNYQILNQLIGNGRVRSLFAGVSWN